MIFELKMAATSHHDVNIIEHTKEEDKSLWSELPTELVDLIAGSAYATNPGIIGTIRATCKSWSSISSIIRCPLPSQNEHQYPYLLMLKDDICKFIHPIYDHSFHLEIPALLDVFNSRNWIGCFLFKEMTLIFSSIHSQEQE